MVRPDREVLPPKWRATLDRLGSVTSRGRLRPALRTLAASLVLVGTGTLLLNLPLQAGLGRAVVTIDPSRVTGAGGTAYQAGLRPPVPGLRVRSEDAGLLLRPTPRLLEDGRALGPARSLHADIREHGAGRFSVWKRSLFFSAGDNSDPRTNGRRYELVASYVLDRWAIGSAIAAFVAGCLTLAATSTRRGRSWGDVLASAWRGFRSPTGPGGRGGGAPASAGLAGVALGLVAAWGVLFWVPPLPLATVPLALDAIAVAAAIAAGTVLAMLLAARRRLTGSIAAGAGRRSELLLAVLLPAAGLVAFVLPVYERWRSAETTYFALAGFLPWSDASGYLFGGEHLLETGTLDDWNARRPMNAALVALRLALTGGDLRLVIVLHTLLAGIACLVAAREVARSLGLAAGVVFFGALLAFAREYTPTMMSETHGLIFGAVAFATIWRGAVERSTGVFGAGMCVLAMALGARSGAFFVLPALLAWGCVSLPGTCPGPGRRLSVRALVIGGLATAGGLSVPFLFHALWGSGGQLVQGNFSYTLYGLAAGGKGWMQVFTDHPELFDGTVPGGAVEARIYELAFEKIRIAPVLFAQAYLHGIGRVPSFFLGFVPDPVYAVLSALGILSVMLNRGGPPSALLLVALSGIAVSAPFLLGDGGPRVFAATAPFLCAFAPLGLRAVTGAVAGREAVENEQVDPEPCRAVPPQGLAVGLALAGVLGPIVAIALAPRPVAVATTCGPGQTAASFVAGKAEVRVHPDATLPASYVPDVRDGDFKRDPAYGGLEIAPLLRELQPPYALAWGHTNVLVVFEGQLLGLHPGARYLACGRLIRDARSGSDILRVVRIERLGR